MATDENRGGAATSVAPLRVFVVENHQDTRALLVVLLEALGHTVRSTDTMAEALRQLPGAGCDVLISDIGLPDGDGWQLMERLQLPGPIYAVAMSGFGMTGDRARSRAVGFRHHLVKPYGIEDLPKILRDAAQERTRWQQAAQAVAAPRFTPTSPAPSAPVPCSGRRGAAPHRA